MQLADELDDFVLRLSARFNRANLLHAIGVLGEAADLYTAIIDSLGGELELTRFGWPGIPSILARGLLTWSLVCSASFERARQTKDRAMNLVDGSIRDPYSTVYAYIGEGLDQFAIGHPSGAIAAFEAAHRITQQADIVLPIATAWLGAAYAQGGRPRDALVLLMEAERKGAYRFGGLYNAIHHYMALAQAHLAVGALPAAQLNRPRPGNRRAGRRTGRRGLGLSHPWPHRSGRSFVQRAGRLRLLPARHRHRAASVRGC